MKLKTYSMDDIMRFSEWSGSDVVYVPAIRAEDMSRAMDSRDPIVVVMEDISCICGEKKGITEKPMPDNTPDEKRQNGKPELNMAANIVNNLFLDSDYQGKDWEAVRKELIERLGNEIASAKAEGRRGLKEELLGKMPKEIKYSPSDCSKVWNDAIKEITDLISNI